jgi:heme/copper-type cytochrome/quinol oxidase subunit 4
MAQPRAAHAQSSAAMRVTEWLKYDFTRVVALTIIALLVIPVGDYFLKMATITIMAVSLTTLFVRILAAPHHSTQSKLGLRVMAALVSAVIVIFVTSQYSCWCCLHQADLQTMCDTLVATAKTLEQNGVGYW